MFAFLPHSFAVANIREFIADLKAQPTYVADLPEAHGFEQVAKRLLVLQSR
jgi:hypothetical protein